MKALLIFTILFSQFATAKESSLFNVEFIKYGLTKIRTGIIKTDAEVKKGTVMYLQGLGDSMMNHDPLFKEISSNGFDVIAFDYMGQGGSTGYMNFTTIKNIGELTDKVWDHYVKDQREKKILLGWSTGGLAAYRYAYVKPNKVDSIILLAPGIAPKVWIGDKMTITKNTLTQNSFESTEDPHVDPIRPTSPLKAPGFAVNLLKTAAFARLWKMPASVNGLVLLASNEDTYVDNAKTKRVIEKNASHFNKYMYEGTGALHELDNELDYISLDVRERIIAFLLK